jgi:hypothetical protein
MAKTLRDGSKTRETLAEAKSLARRQTQVVRSR